MRVLRLFFRPIALTLWLFCLPLFVLHIQSNWIFVGPFFTVPFWSAQTYCEWAFNCLYNVDNCVDDMIVFCWFCSHGNAFYWIINRLWCVLNLVSADLGVIQLYKFKSFRKCSRSTMAICWKSSIWRTHCDRSIYSLQMSRPRSIDWMRHSIETHQMLHR